MAFNNPKSILKEPEIGLYEDVNTINGRKRAEKLFDDLFSVNKQNTHKYDRNCNTKRAPLKTIHANVSQKQRSLDSSDLDNENDMTCIDAKEQDFEPSAKTCRRKIDKNYNRVKFAVNIDNRVKKVTKKKKTKKDKDYPDCTKEALLKAFESANLPDYDEIARHELVVTKVNGKEDLRTDPPTPPMYQIMKPFEDLIDWSKVDMKSDESPNKVPLKEFKQTDRRTTSSASNWETTQSNNDSHEDNDDVFDVDFVSNERQSNANNIKSTKSIIDEMRNPSTLNITDFSKREDQLTCGVIFKKNERLRTAGLGDSRIASTPVSHRLNVTLRSHNVSPIKSIVSPEADFNSTKSKANDKSEQTFVAPLPKSIRQSRKVSKTSIPKENIRLELVKPSLIDIEKVTSRTDCANEVSRSLIDAKLCNNCEELTVINNESNTLTEKSNKSVNCASSDPLLASKDGSYNLRRINNKTSNYNRTNELSSIFAPKIKSTPLVATKQKHDFNSRNDLTHSKFDLLVDENHLDVSMSKLFPSKSYSHIISFPIKTTTIVPVLDSESERRKTVNRKSNAYHIYRKSIAAVHSVYNKSCHPCRTVVNTRTLVSFPNHFVATDLNSKQDLKQCIDNSLSVAFSTSKVVFNDGIEELLTAKQKVLLLCEPNQIIDFKDVFDSKILKNSKKIGEGSYGEVYASKDVCGQDFVIKIIPLNMTNADSDEDIFSQILPELVISTTFNHLKDSESRNKASNFIHMMKATCAKGLFPRKLIKEWDLYAKQKVSENEDPRVYDKNQLYIILQLANGGTDLESYQFNNAIEALSLFSQLALSLAAAESQYEFEHRDMHWGNVLISTTNQTNLQYIVNGINHSLNTNGVFASIIDFSLSRMSKDGFIIYDDLDKYSDLFTGEGDYQFDIYRKMKEHNQNDWQKFSPKTNIFWLHYLLDKLLNSNNHYCDTISSRSKLHKTCLNSLQKMSQNILKFKSSADFVNNSLFKQLLKKFNSL